MKKIFIALFGLFAGVGALFFVYRSIRSKPTLPILYPEIEENATSDQDFAEKTALPESEFHLESSEDQNKSARLNKSTEFSNLLPSSRSEKIIKKDLQEVIGSAPSLVDYRAEVASDPHRTPPSLMRVAVVMADDMKRAKKDPEHAQKFFEKLQQCTRSNTQSGPLSVFALCAENARELNVLYPKLFKESYASLYRELPKEVKRLVRDKN